VFSNLLPDTAPNVNNEPPPEPQYNGYYIVVTDTSNPQQSVTIYDLILIGVTALNVTTTTVKPICYDSKNGKITINASGGVQPYQIVTNSSSQSFVGNNITTAQIGNYTITVTDNSDPEQSVTIDNLLLKSVEPEMILVRPTEIDLAKQCDPTQYKIKLRIEDGQDTNFEGLTYRTKYASAYYQINYNGDENSDDELIWSQPPTQATYNNLGEFEVTIPATTIFESVGIRLCNPQGTCGSDIVKDETDFDLFEMLLPPNVLALNVNNINNSKQCQPNSVSFKFNVSHLSLGATYRAPYRLDYQIANVNNSYGPLIQSQIFITQNQQLITLPVPQILGNPSPSAKIKIRVTDKVGCVSPFLEIGPIQIPTQELNVIWSSQFVSGTPNTPNAIYTKSYQISGGIPPYTTTSGQPLLPSPNATTASANVAFNNGLTITVQDSAGCIITKNSG
jgi:hypothetical protein